MMQMNLLPAYAYEAWRGRFCGAPQLQESAAPAPSSERLLQAIWRHQRLWRERLRTLDGRTVRVLHPGFWNREAGPDFCRAIVQLGEAAPITGDIEVDLNPSQWQGHRHQDNPAYQKVILHVVWDGEPSHRSEVPALVMKPYLDAPLAELETWLCSDAAFSVPPVYQGQCSRCLRDIGRDLVYEVLRQAARIRLQSKARELQARARQSGWEQALWEGLFRGLGYKNNAWPMHYIAELIPRLRHLPSESSSPWILWQARLLGLAGFLPDDLTRARSGTDRYLRRVWDVWWRERETLGDGALPRNCWRLHGLRPANHPQRRLALAAHWLANGALLERLENWFHSDGSLSQQRTGLLAIFQVEADEFWSWHWTWKAEMEHRPQPLLGMQRLTDLTVNVLLPWFWMRATSAGNAVLQQKAEALYFEWPKSEDNAVLRLARQRLLGDAPLHCLSRASAQQGLLQIVHDFCERTNALCADCPFPEFLKSALE
jgi:hypothetical protein